jgi:hypothetical protein
MTSAASLPAFSHRIVGKRKVVAGFPLVGGGTENLLSPLRKEVNGFDAVKPAFHLRTRGTVARWLKFRPTRTVFSLYYFYRPFLNDRQNQEAREKA